MKNIKNIFQKIGKGLIIPLLALFLIISSCEEIIDLQPYNQVSETTAFTSAQTIALSVIGMYNAAQLGYYNNNPRGYPFGAAFVEQGDNRGEDVVNTAAFYQYTYTATYSPTTLNNVWMWSDTYRLINRCNIIIEGVQKAGASGVIPAALAAQYEGEARLLRAFSYHELMIHFARPYNHTNDHSHFGVPYYDKSFTTQAAMDAAMAAGRATAGTVYTNIIADLDFAEANLPLKAGYTGNQQVTRGTKGAAVALKTRIYMHMWDMAKVITEGSKFLTGGSLAGQYVIEANPWSTFASPFNFSNRESIFGLEHSATSNPNTNAALGNMYGATGSARKLVCISPIIWRNARWLTDDKRRTEGSMITTNAGVKYTYKYKDYATWTDPSPMIRYAEVLLNLAEAYARNNDVVNGLAMLNAVRNRSLADPATQAYTAASFVDNVAMVGAILDERRIEFLMEGRRWSDIHRLQHDPIPAYKMDGIPAKYANAVPAAADYTLGTPYSGPYGVSAYPYSDYRFVWPIPQDEVNANPKLMEQQNPQW